MRFSKEMFKTSTIAAFSLHISLVFIGVMRVHINADNMLNDHSFKFGKISLLVPSHHLIARLFEYCKNAKSHCIFFIGTIKMHNK